MATATNQPYRIPLTVEESHALVALSFMVNQGLFGTPGSPVLKRIFEEAFRVNEAHRVAFR